MKFSKLSLLGLFSFLLLVSGNGLEGPVFVHLVLVKAVPNSVGACRY